MTPLNPPQDLLGALARGERSASELLEQCLGRIADTDGRVNAFTRISHVRARAARPPTSTGAAGSARRCRRWPGCRMR